MWYHVTPNYTWAQGVEHLAGVLLATLPAGAAMLVEDGRSHCTLVVAPGTKSVCTLPPRTCRTTSER